MSLENKIDELKDAIDALITVMSQAYASAPEKTTPSSSNTTSAAPESAVPETEDKPAKKTRTRKSKEAPVKETVKAEEVAEETDSDGFDDDFGFEEDESVAEATKNYSGQQAGDVLKALRDAASIILGSGEGLKVAKETLGETGFGKLNDITDEKGAEAVGLAVAKAKKLGFYDTLVAKAALYGVSV